MSINFEAQTDRELLILVAQTTNEASKHLAKLNSKIEDHDNRIHALEKQQRGRRYINWTTLTLMASALALVIMSVGSKVGWW